MAEVSPGDKVVYGTFVGTVRQLVGDDMCVILLRAPMSDGAMTLHAPTEKCEVVSVLPAEDPPDPSEEEIPAEPVEEAPPETSAETPKSVETPETESTETAEESAEEETN